jgi:plasmid stabilization system protein ParE
MADIKSAFEIAKEKIEKLGEATEDEKLKWKYMPQGEQLAAKYLKEDINLIAEVSKFPEQAKKYIKQGAAEVLIHNISIPRNDFIKNTNKKVMEGLRLLKDNRAELENVYSRIRRLFDHYAEQGEQQRQKAYQSLKSNFEVKARQAVQQQLGSTLGMRIDVERLPQFQMEWRRLLNDLDSQYMVHLNEYRQEITEIS